MTANNYRAAGTYSVTASELARQIAAEKAAAEQRIADWKASLPNARK